MALPILDGNQTAATLSTIITGGAHIPAHTVVSLGATAIANIASAVSGVPIAGTVTANVPLSPDAYAGNYGIRVVGNGSDGALRIGGYDPIYGGQLNLEDGGGIPVFAAGQAALPISGTVTANGGDGTFLVGGLRSGSKTALSLDVGTGYLQTKVESLPAISGTVTIGVVSQGAFGATINGYSTDTGGQLFQNCVPVKLFHGSDARLGAVTVGNSVTIGSLPSGALTTRFGSVTTANTAQITSAVTNTSRKYLLAQNISAGTVTIGIGFSPTTTQGIQLTAGGGLTFDAFCPTGAVYWLGAVTGAAYTILEG